MRLTPILALLFGCPAAEDTGSTASVDTSPPDEDGDGADATVDCDDTNPAVYPGAPDVPRNGVDEDCDPATCLGDGFVAAPTSFSLPAEYGNAGAFPFDQASSYASCTDATPSHTLMDVSGDGRLDLVVTFVCGDDEATGDTRWLVHAGIEGGFVASAVDWSLPSEYGEAGAAPFANPTSAVVCGDGIPAHFVTDLTGDGLPDLVITELCDDDVTGRTQWAVHEGSPAGFASTATAWALPAGFGEADYLPFSAASAPASCLKGVPAHTLTDLTGDGLPDLVVTQSCTDLAVGSSQWQVYAGTGAGFSASATVWTLPGAYAAEGKLPFVSPAASASCGEGIPGHDLADLTGDGLPDLVLTETCDLDPTVGDTRWFVHAGMLTGFAESATDWALPEAYGAASSTPFSLTNDLGNTTDDAPGHSLTDLDHDGFLDLVIQGVPSDSTIGSAVWTVFFGSSAGFAPEPRSWALPSVGGTSPFSAPRTTADCANSLPAWALLDLDGDDLAELVLTRSCADDTVGDTTWATYEAVCSE